MESYNAMCLVAPETVEPVVLPEREPGPHEVRIKVCLAGVCGTDLALYHGHYKVPLPCVMGHEFVGEVEAIGENVHERWLGKRVAVEINVCEEYAKSTGESCPACGELTPHHCNERTVLGIIQSQGAFATTLYAPARNLHTLPDTISDEAAVLVEPVAAALQTFVMRPIKTGQQTGQRVVVLGAGRLGVLIVAVAKSLGAEVIAISRSRSRLDMAAAFGAHHTLQAGDDLVERLLETGQGGLADVVVEVTGNPAGLNDAIGLVKPRGTICLKTTVGELSEVDLTRVVVDEIQLSGSRCGPFAEAIHFLERHTLPFKDWFRAVYPLGQLADAMDEATLPGKVLVDPSAQTVTRWPLR